MKIISEKTEIEPIGLRPKIAAFYLAIGVSTLWALAKKEILTPIKITPGVTVFSKMELDELFQEKLRLAKIKQENTESTMES